MNVEYIFIEDEKDIRDQYQNAVERYNKNHKDIRIISTITKDLDGTVDNLDNKIYDMYFIDLKLRNDQNYSGKKIVKMILAQSPGSMITIVSANVTQVEDKIKQLQNVTVVDKSSKIRIYDIIEEQTKKYMSFSKYISEFKKSVFTKLDFSNFVELFQVIDSDDYLNRINHDQKNIIVSRVVTKHILDHFNDNYNDKNHVLEYYSLNKSDPNELINGQVLKKEDILYLLITPQCSIIKNEKITHYNLCVINNHDEDFKGNKNSKILPDLHMYGIVDMHIDFTNIISILTDDFDISKFELIATIRPPFIDEIQNMIGFFLSSRGTPNII